MSTPRWVSLLQGCDCALNHLPSCQNTNRIVGGEPQLRDSVVDSLHSVSSRGLGGKPLRYFSARERTIRLAKVQQRSCTGNPYPGRCSFSAPPSSVITIVLGLLIWKLDTPSCVGVVIRYIGTGSYVSERMDSGVFTYGHGITAARHTITYSARARNCPWRSYISFTPLLTLPLYHNASQAPGACSCM